MRVTNAGQINAVAEAQEVVQDFLADLFGETNLGDTAFDALRRVQHCNLMSHNYEDQLMEFTAASRDWVWMRVVGGVPSVAASTNTSGSIGIVVSNIATATCKHVLVVAVRYA